MSLGYEENSLVHGEYLFSQTEERVESFDLEEETQLWLKLYTLESVSQCLPVHA